MILESVELREIHLPLVEYFETSLGRTHVRRIILLTVGSGDKSGYGECTAEEEPLWLYILNEAVSSHNHNPGNQLGPVGSVIVAEVFAGLLWSDNNSYLKLMPRWTPSAEPFLQGKGPINSNQWEFADIIRLAQMPESGDQINDLLSGG